MRKSATVAMLAVLLALTPARADDVPSGVIFTSGQFYQPGDNRPIRGIAPVPVYVVAGTTLVHYNQDLDAHNITADDLGPDGQPIFKGPSLNQNKYALVPGIAALEPGTYGFHCTFHSGPLYPSQAMRGTLIVVP